MQQIVSKGLVSSHVNAYLLIFKLDSDLQRQDIA